MYNISQIKTTDDPILNSHNNPPGFHVVPIFRQTFKSFNALEFLGFSTHRFRKTEHPGKALVGPRCCFGRLRWASGRTPAGRVHPCHGPVKSQASDSHLENILEEKTTFHPSSTKLGDVWKQNKQGRATNARQRNVRPVYHHGISGVMFLVKHKILCKKWTKSKAKWQNSEGASRSEWEVEPGRVSPPPLLVKRFKHHQRLQKHQKPDQLRQMGKCQRCLTQPLYVLDFLRGVAGMGLGRWQTSNTKPTCSPWSGLQDSVSLTATSCSSMNKRLRPMYLL